MLLRSCRNAPREPRYDGGCSRRVSGLASDVQRLTLNAGKVAKFDTVTHQWTEFTPPT